nr:thioredoxin-like 4, chloroplastic [Ipomoea batatas]
MEKAKQTGALVVVDFYRTSCGSCKYIEQGFVKLCKGSGDQDAPVVFLKHNVLDEYDEQSEVAERLRIRPLESQHEKTSWDLLDPYLNGLKKLRIVVKVLENPGQDTGGRVLRREQNSDDVVGDLVVVQSVPFLVCRIHETAQKPLLLYPLLLPLVNYFADYVAQSLPRLQIIISMALKLQNRALPSGDPQVFQLTNLLHLLESVDGVAGGSPGVQCRECNCFNVCNTAANRVGAERPLHHLPQPHMVAPLVEEQRRRAYQALLALRICRLEQVRRRH